MAIIQGNMVFEDREQGKVIYSAVSGIQSVIIQPITEMKILLGIPCHDHFKIENISVLLNVLFFKSKVTAETSSTDSTVSTDTSETLPPDPTPVRPSKPTRPNVAVITMYDKELGENTVHQHKRQKKSPAKKKQSSLSVQVRTKMIWIKNAIQ